jgi:hypothetical protein
MTRDSATGMPSSPMSPRVRVVRNPATAGPKPTHTMSASML